MKRQPKFEKLSEPQCRALLRRHPFGRLAYAFRDRIDIEPISHVLDGNWLYGRTSPGTKLTRITHNRWVAFQVDEIDGPFDWRSVVAHGTVYFLNPNGNVYPEYERAIKLLRTRDPVALTEADLTPQRTIVFRIHINELTGRRARWGKAGTKRRA